MPSALVILLLFALSASAQQPWEAVFMGNAIPTPGNSAVSYYATNIPGYPAVAYYTRPDLYYYVEGFTTGKKARWTNLVTANSGLDLTNIQSANIKNPFLHANAIGTNASLQFTNLNASFLGCLLRNEGFSSSKPFSLFTVLQFNGYVSAAGYIFAGTNGSGFSILPHSNQKDLFNSSSYMGWVVTNKFYCRYDEFKDSTHTTSLTNNVQQGTGNFGDKVLLALQVGDNNGATDRAVPIEILDLAVYYTNLPASVTSNLFFTFTNRYGISL